MRIIMLDVDGVLCTRRSHLVYGTEGGIWHEWDQLAVDAICKACKRGPQIVLSSTWRKPTNIEHFHDRCKKYGLDPRFFYRHGEDWMTPSLPSGKRGDEIQAWLDKHPEVMDYRIIDDDQDMLEHQLPKCIFTDHDDGMLGVHIKKLLNWAGALKS